MRTLYICATGGVITIVFSLSAAFMRGKIAAERSRAFPAASRHILRIVFPEIVFLFVCVIVLCASQDSPCDDFPRMRNYSTLLFSCIE